MRKNRKLVFGALSVVAALLIGGAIFSVADEYIEHKRHKSKDSDRHHSKENHESTRGKAAFNAAYAELCGGCHWAYVPALLPAKSWANIMATLNDHFGNDVVLTGQQTSDISGFLASNSAEETSAKIGRKITQSLGGASPTRIIDIPYIQKKHRKIDKTTFSRAKIKSLSNCIACHPSASSARFDDDEVNIPQE